MKASNNCYRWKMPYENGHTDLLSYPKSRDAMASKNNEDEDPNNV